MSLDTFSSMEVLYLANMDNNTKLNLPLDLCVSQLDVSQDGDLSKVVHPWEMI